MARFEGKSQKKTEPVEHKPSVSHKESLPSHEQFQTWGQNSFSPTPFQPPLNQHAALLSLARSDAQRASMTIQLQQNYGNRYVQHLVKSVQVQSKPTDSQPEALFKQKAYQGSEPTARIADQTRVMNSPGSMIQRIKKGFVKEKKEYYENLKNKNNKTSPDKNIGKNKTPENKPGAISQGTKSTTEKEKKVSQPVTKGPTPPKVKPPVPIKNYNLQPIMEQQYKKRFSSMQPVKSKKDKIESDTQIRIMDSAQFEERAQNLWFGPLLDSLEYKEICKRLKDYHGVSSVISNINLVEKQSEDYVLPLENRLDSLKSLDNIINSWLQKFHSFSRKVRKEAINELKFQVADEMKRLENAKSEIPVIFRDYRKSPETYLSRYDHFLEAYDKYHRDYTLLKELWDEWSKKPNSKKWAAGFEPPPAEFFTWLETNDKANQAIKTPIKYYAKEERNDNKLKFEGARPKIEKSGKSLLSGIFVMSSEGDFFSQFEGTTKKGEDTTKQYHHSSFMAGLPVAAAGKLKYSSSTDLLDVTLESGHYLPKVIHMVNVVNMLEKNKVNKERVLVHPFPPNISLDGMVATRFIDELKQLKNGKLKELENILKKGKEEAKKASENEPVLSKNILTNNNAYLQILDALNAVKG